MMSITTRREFHRPDRRAVCGFLLIEAMVAILIFSLGVLGLVAMGSTAIAAQSDAHYRTDAARLVDDITNTISLNVDRSTTAKLAASLLPFQHQRSGADCGQFSGDPSASKIVTDWVNQVESTGAGKPGLPGAVDGGQQITIDPTATGFNRIQVSVCWRSPGMPASAPMRRHTVVSYIN